ncbi:MAG: hypothetical protein IT375_34875 [Polyangiaceae bacterium]|nr:hypothetical protein [Polyangiaceae bacterium]
MGLITILIDTREQAPLQFGEAVRTERATLATGDYSAAGVTDLVALERKSLADLTTCCGRDRERFLAQIQRLRAFPVRGLVIEGDAPSIAAGAYRSQIRPASVIGTLVAICTDHAIPVWLATDAHHAAIIVERILRRVHDRQDDIRRDLPGVAELEPMRVRRSDVVRALREIREQHEEQIGALLAALEADSGKHAERESAVLP